MGVNIDLDDLKVELQRVIAPRNQSSSSVTYLLKASLAPNPAHDFLFRSSLHQYLKQLRVQQLREQAFREECSLHKSFGMSRGSRLISESNLERRPIYERAQELFEQKKQRFQTKRKQRERLQQQRQIQSMRESKSKSRSRTPQPDFYQEKMAWLHYSQQKLKKLREQKQAQTSRPEAKLKGSREKQAAFLLRNSKFLKERAMKIQRAKDKQYS